MILFSKLEETIPTKKGKISTEIKETSTTEEEPTTSKQDRPKNTRKKVKTKPGQKCKPATSEAATGQGDGVGQQ